jgi:putative endonuclease
LYYERYEFVEDAIRREKEIKGWRRSKKEALINTENPEWRFLNDEIGG